MMSLAGRIRRASCGKPSPYIRFMFRMMVLSRKKAIGDVPAETGYWQENGWLNGRVPWKNYAE